jgi:hypothetical protein
MKIIKNGNFTSLVRSLLLIIGGCMIFIPIYTHEYTGLPKNVILLISLFGLGLAALGGYTAQADTYRLHPFGDLTWPKDKPGEKSKEESRTEKFLDGMLTAFFTIVFIGVVLYLSLDPKVWENGAMVKLSAAVVVSLVIYFGIRKSRSK